MFGLTAVLSATLLFAGDQPKENAVSEVAAEVRSVVPEVPFYSQFKDIRSPEWQKVGCGVTSLAMVVNYYKPEATSADILLAKGIASRAYQKNAGWIHAGLIKLAEGYGLEGNAYYLTELDRKAALEELEKHLVDGPVIASVHYQFDPKSLIPHLVVINGIKDGMVYYNDPAAKKGGEEISVDRFLKAWKKRFIVIRPEASVQDIARGI